MAKRVIDQLAEALRSAANYTYEDAVNCWCGSSKCIQSVACINARKALKAYARHASRSTNDRGTKQGEQG